MKCSFELKYTVGQKEEVLTESNFVSADLRLDITDDGQRRTVTLEALRPIEKLSYCETSHDFFELREKNTETLCFLNGYQSWTDTKEFYLSECEHNVNALPDALVKRFSFDRYGDASFFRYDRSILHGYDVFYMKGGKNGFAASLNFDNAYLIFSVERGSGKVKLSSDLCGLTLKKGDKYTVCDYIYAESFSAGIRLLDRFFPKKETKKIFGYTSWYNYYQDINEDIILRDLRALDSRFKLFQIDDGYETYVGDWLDIDREKFPRGLSPIVEKVHNRGFMAGIWLAPFAVEENSRIFREKREWLKCDRTGNPIKCGSNWSGFYALDLENEEALEYIEKCLCYYKEMGFDFFKLDFLYAANLPTYEGKTRCRAASDAYAFLRKVLGNKLILGCGATVANACGKFDYLRVGPDVSLKFDDQWFMRFMHRERISTKVTLQNTVFRFWMDKRFFGNDPDVFLLRDENISLTPKQRRALVLINALFGSVMMTSDNIDAYDEEKNKLLNQAIELFEFGEVTEYKREKNEIAIQYRLGKKDYLLRYDTKKGVLLNG